MKIVKRILTVVITVLVIAVTGFGENFLILGANTIRNQPT